MAEFYGTIRGNRGTLTRSGSIKSGIHASLSSNKNNIQISLIIKDGEEFLKIRMPKNIKRLIETY